jgi:hypothetical protein
MQATQTSFAAPGDVELLEMAARASARLKKAIAVRVVGQ